MKLCTVCHTENEEDALYCKRCAHFFGDEENNNKDTSKNHKGKVKKSENKD